MNSTTPTDTKTPAFELKGHMLTVMVLHVYTSDSAYLAAQLQQKVSQAPAMFKQAPVILDVRTIVEHKQMLDIPFLVEELRGYGMLPIGIRGGGPGLNSMALAVGLHLLANAKSGKQAAELSISEQPAKPQQQETAATETHEQAVPATIIEQPVRSGQQVLAKGDLIILSSVSRGAEVLAHRHIHVYGALRGRALAGIKGDNQARIFCHRLDAELVSVAGQYQINEELDNHILDKPAQIYLEEDQLMIKVFNAGGASR